ncbi:hypothetical protein [Tepidibacter formicigenes]|uniref:Uncharacterized protein n=1 Tax=Tepidibacter formicigenes DSM 15518 TaxID=1123349 RepID=A0A1M6M487_9FIRM|nr:hypothetical protein [Tepidibacter formicigenes]SHJ78241.1 hypothetical protein SAMN02744037_00822 [Tepidibacter formicigenes DSM 15518]
MISFILKVLLFAITITFLLAWGYIKQQRKNEELLNKLYKKIEGKIVTELKKRKELTIKDMEGIIKGTKVSLFWSKNKVMVTEPKILIKNLVVDMINKGLIVEVFNKGSKKYKLK